MTSRHVLNFQQLVLPPIAIVNRPSKKKVGGAIWPFPHGLKITQEHEKTVFRVVDMVSAKFGEKQFETVGRKPVVGKFEEITDHEGRTGQGTAKLFSWRDPFEKGVTFRGGTRYVNLH